jgi:hypothetical protein
MAKKHTHTSDSWLQHALRRTGWRPQRQVIAVGTLGVFIALILGALYISQVALEASRGRLLADLVEQRDELQRQNEELRVMIAELKSLPRLQAEAEALGFVQASLRDQEYITVEGYIPNRQATVAEIRDEAPAIVPDYNERFSDWFSQWVVALRSQFAAFNSRG